MLLHIPLPIMSLQACELLAGGRETNQELLEVLVLQNATIRKLVRELQALQQSQTELSSELADANRKSVNLNNLSGWK